MADLGETWSEVTEAAGATEAAARTYQQAKEDPSRAEEERLQARSEYKQATKRLYEALREAKVQEHDGLWSEVMDAVQRAQAAGHIFLSQKHDPRLPESERLTAKEAYVQAKSRLVSLLGELKIVAAPETAEPKDEVSEPASSEEGQGPAEVAETPEEASEPPAEEQGQEEPEAPGPPSWEAGSPS